MRRGRLEKEDRLPEFRNAMLARAKPSPCKNGKYIISLVIKDRISSVTEKELIRESLLSLRDVIEEIGLGGFSVCQENVDGVTWPEISELIRLVFCETRINITICTNDVLVPPPEQREDIIKENHTSTISGHKGITKTYHRISLKYNWSGMRKDVQNFIRACQNCQLKKLVRTKTKQPMMLTDTPKAAFDKISMDIMGPVTSRAGHSYILTIQDLLTKYFVAIPLKRAGAIDVADALVYEFICIYGAPQAILTF